MTTLTLTPKPDLAAVQIRIDADRVVRSITRTDANGVNAVRTLPGVLPYTPPTTEVRRNFVPNPRFLNSGLYPAGSSMIGGTASTYQTTTPVFTPGLAAGAFNGTTSGASWDLPVPATSSRISAAAAYTRDTLDAVLKIDAYNAAGAVVATVTVRNTAGGILTATTPVPTGPVVRVVLSLYVENATGAALTVAKSGTFKEPIVEIANAAGYYFDGGSFGRDDRAYAFTGTIHNSPSTESTYAGVLTLTDYEPASGALSYVAAGYSTKTDAFTASLTLDGPWVYCPILPAYSVKLQAVTGYGARVDSHSTIVDDLLGRSTPIVIMRETGSRAGSLELYAGTYADAAVILQALGRGEVLMLRQPEHAGMDMYFAGKSATVSTLLAAGGRTVFGVTVEYVETGRPPGFLAGAIGWTFSSVAGAAPTFADLPNLFDTFEDLRLNKRITA